MREEVESWTDLAGKVAVITGATSGVGAALAERLAGLGVQLGLGGLPGRVLGIDGAYEDSCDVRDFSQVTRLVETTAQRFGRLDILVASAGVGSYQSFLEAPMDHLEEMIDTNVKGTIYLLRAGLPRLIAAGAGDVIVIASEAGRRGVAGQAVYSASKFGQLGLTRALDNEMRVHNIRCAALCPGGIATNFAMGEERGRTPESLSGMMTAGDVVDIILFTLTRPRHMRLLETAFRPMSEASRG
jgi:3-oxoacyl-[acyl-carrier protein] reductase